MKRTAMRRSAALGMAVIGGAVALSSLTPGRRTRLREAMRRRMRERMARVMENMPDDAPPKLVVSVLPRLREQNDRIIALLREQNELLREQRHAGHGVGAGEM